MSRALFFGENLSEPGFLGLKDLHDLRVSCDSPLERGGGVCSIIKYNIKGKGQCDSLPATARSIAPLPGEGIKNSVAYILSSNLQYYLRCRKSETLDEYAYSLQTT